MKMFVIEGHVTYRGVVRKVRDFVDARNRRDALSKAVDAMAAMGIRPEAVLSLEAHTNG
jgi:hypothetical protein